MADLISQIAELQAEFQRIADRHPWLCLSVPPLVDNPPPPYVGWLVQAPSPLPGNRALSEEWNKEFDRRGPPPWVMAPDNAGACAVVNHVNVLNHRAGQLLLRVLNVPHHIPDDVVQEIRDWHGRDYGSGTSAWVRWLWFAVPAQRVPVGKYPGRFENYAQVAATALEVLKDWCSSLPPAKNEPARRMTPGQANAEAKKRVKQYRQAFFAMSKRQQAALIGCHHRTWEQTDLYKSALKKGLIPAPKPRAPKAVSLTKRREAATGDGGRDETQKNAADQELRRLAAEQAADHEPSPLSVDPPGRERKVHSRKRL